MEDDKFSRSYKRLTFNLMVLETWCKFNSLKTCLLFTLLSFLVQNTFIPKIENLWSGYFLATLMVSALGSWLYQLNEKPLYSIKTWYGNMGHIEILSYLKELIFAVTRSFYWLYSNFFVFDVLNLKKSPKTVKSAKISSREN